MIIPKGIYRLIGFSLSVVFAVGCKSASHNTETDSISGQVTESNAVKSDRTQWALSKADSVLTLMTLEERIGQCFMPSMPSDALQGGSPYLNKLLKDNHIGGFVLLDGDIKSAEEFGQLAKSQKIPLFVGIDAEWGLGMRLKGGSVFPKNGYIEKNLHESVLFDYGREVGKESRLLGINMVFGPVVDLTSSKYGPIGARSFGDDPKRVADFAVAYAKGLESEGVISVAKHFPGHGSSLVDSHRSLGVVYKNISELDTTDFYPFMRYIDTGLSGVMVGHLYVRALSPEMIPAPVSHEILTTLLRDEMQFKGLVLTDAFNMGGAKGYKASDALKAGADIILLPSDISKEVSEVINEIQTGKMDERIVNDRCRRILFTKFLFGLWDEEYRPSLSPYDATTKTILDLQSLELSR